MRRGNQKSEVGSRRSGGFSLMEIMVVLVVISIMVGLLFPALLAARERARQNRARSEAFELQKAWQVYYTTYEELPSYSEMTPAATQILGGDNDNKITFMEFSPEELLEGFKDPWGEPYQLSLAEGDTVTTKWSFQSRVHCVNAQRYKY